MEQFIREAMAQEIPKDLEKVAAAKANIEDEFLDKENVVGVGIGRKVENGVETDTESVVVLVEQKMDESMLSTSDKIPRTTSRIPTDVVDVGMIWANHGFSDDVDDEAVGRAASEVELQLDDVDAQTLRNRVRPVRPGFSVGHPRVTAGTIGAGCYDLTPFPGKPPRYYILSNNHVIANSNNANLGDPIIQPGRVDGGRVPQDVIGRLSRFVPISFPQPGQAPRCNYVDAAIAQVPFHLLDRDIYWNGYPSSLFKAAAPGMIVKKTGRTTDFTTGRVTAINATVNVNYGGGRIAKFCRQIVTTDMSAGGDSGSLVLDTDNEPVGLLFAGSSTATILNPIAWVQGLLRVRLWP